MAELLEVYGPNISAVTSQEWPRHRKVLAAPFNESIMNMVWRESLSQATQMIASWTSPMAGSPKNAIRSVAKDTRTLPLNVLAATGFGRSFAFMSMVIE
jgi:cytochrome P450